MEDVADVVQSEELDLSQLKVVPISTSDEVAIGSPVSSKIETVDEIDRLVVVDCPGSSKVDHNENVDDINRIVVDTAAPIESVKDAVSKFGGIVDWKAHKIQTVERRKLIEEELERTEEEIPEYKNKTEAAELEKLQVLRDLDATKRLIEDFKLNLERAQTEEHQAKQDSELAKLRVEEIEQGIANEASVAAKAQLEVAKARHAAAIIELKSVNEELEELKKDYESLVTEKDLAVKKAEDARLASMEVEKTVQELTIELISVKDSLESAHAAHLEADERRIGAEMARDQDYLSWEAELKLAEEEIAKLDEQVSSSTELKAKFDTASSLLIDLKAEFSAYMESERSENPGSDQRSHSDIQAAVAAARKELEEVKINIKKANEEVSTLNQTVTSLKSELKNEKLELSKINQREGMASVAVASLQAEIEKTKAEIDMLQNKKRATNELILDLPEKMLEAVQESDQAKLDSENACEELKKAKEEAEHTQAGARTMQSRLLAAQKETEAAKASEKLALAAIRALHESESARTTTNEEKESPKGVTLTLEEYYALSKKAHDAEEQATARIAAAISEIETAKECELMSMKKLEEINQEMIYKKEGLKIAMEKAEKAKEGKLSVEQELRKWRAENEQRRKANELSADQGVARSSVVDRRESSKYELAPDGTTVKKKRRSLFPRILMFLVRKKAHPPKSS